MASLRDPQLLTRGVHGPETDGVQARAFVAFTHRQPAAEEVQAESARSTTKIGVTRVEGEAPKQVIASLFTSCKWGALKPSAAVPGCS